jgi:lipopolysaccharide export system permease protein
MAENPRVAVARKKRGLGLTMSILFRYVTREILKQFAVIATVVVVVYVAVDFLEKIEDVLKSGLPFTEFLVFFLFKIPLVLVQITPVAALIATLVVFGLMKRHNEITALKSSGLGTIFLLKPALLTGVGFCLFLFVLSEIVVPATISRANLIWLKKVRHKASSTVKQQDIWIKGNGVIMHIQHYNPDEKTAYGLSLNFFEPSLRLTRRIDAHQAVYTGSAWTLTGAMDHRFDENGDIRPATDTGPLTVHIDIVPEDLGRAVKRSEEMGFFELRRRIRKIAAEGYGTALYRVDLHAKIAFPFVCLLMSLIGTGLGAAGRAMGGMTATIAYGIGISFAYWMLYGFSLSLGYGGVLPPLAAAWAANIVFFLLAWAILVKAG